MQRQARGAQKPKTKQAKHGGNQRTLHTPKLPRECGQRVAECTCFRPSIPLRAEAPFAVCPLTRGYCGTRSMRTLEPLTTTASSR